MGKGLAIAGGVVLLLLCAFAWKDHRLSANEQGVRVSRHLLTQSFRVRSAETGALLFWYDPNDCALVESIHKLPNGRFEVVFVERTAYNATTREGSRSNARHSK